MRFRRAFIVTVSVQTASLAVSALFVLLTSRWLGSAGKGLQAVLQSSAQILSIVLGLGLPMSVVFFVAGNPLRTPAIIRNQARLTVMVAVSLGVAAILNRWFALYPPLFFYEGLVGLFVIALLAQAAFSVLLLALGHTWSYNISLAAPNALALVYVAIQRAVTGTIDVASVVRAQAVGTLLAVLFSLLVLRRDSRTTPHPDQREVGMREQVRVGIKGFLSHIFSMSTFRGDFVLIAILTRDLRAAGIYSIAVFILESALSVPRWAAALLSRRTAADSSNPEETIHLFWFSIAIMIVELCPVLILGSLAERLLGGILGRGFEGTYAVLLTVVPRGIIHSGNYILAGDLAGRGYTWFHPAAYLAGMLTVFALDLLLVPRFGLAGAGAASSVGAVATFVILMRGFFYHAGIGVHDFRAHSLTLPMRLKVQGRSIARNDP